MMDEAAPMGRAAIVKRLFQGVEDEAGMGRPASSPADDPPGIGIDDEGEKSRHERVFLLERGGSAIST